MTAMLRIGTAVWVARPVAIADAIVPQPMNPIDTGEGGSGEVAEVLLRVVMILLMLLLLRVNGTKAANAGESMKEKK